MLTPHPFFQNYPNAVAAQSRLSPTTSAIVVYGVALALATFVVALCILAQRQRKRAARARALLHAHTQAASLTPGPSILRGTVELDATTPFAARAHVTQDGEEKKGKGGTHYAWNEVEREVISHTFHLRLPDGARVRVEPGGHALLVDALVVVAQPQPTRRVKGAQIDAGDTTTAVGTLVRGLDPSSHDQAGAYRSSGEGWILRSRQGEPMTLSGAPLEKRHLERAAFLRNWAWLGAAAFVAIALFFTSYHALTLSGTTIDTRYSHREKSESPGPRPSGTHFVLSGDCIDAVGVGRTLTDECSPWLFDLAGEYSRPMSGSADPERQLDVPFRIAGPFVQIGLRPTIDGTYAMFAIVALIAFGGAFALARHVHRPWYERRRLVDEGLGPLV